MALAHAADWRWLLDREDSPWYPTMRLFRQKQPGDWDEVFEHDPLRGSIFGTKRDATGRNIGVTPEVFSMSYKAAAFLEGLLRQSKV